MRFGTPTASGLVANAIEVGVNRVHADEELFGDLGVGPALANPELEQFLLPRAENLASW